MRIAVLLGLATFDSQKKIMRGINAGAMADKCDVYYFMCDAMNYITKNKYETGEYSIYSLPDFSQFDGVIVLMDTIHNLKVNNEIIERIREAGIPCSSINRQIEGFICIQLDNYSGMYDIVEHLYQHHKVDKSFFILGEHENVDSTERLEAVTKYLNGIGKTIGEDDYAYGDYTYKSGYSIVENYLKSGRKLPDVFICMNDNMALGALSCLKASGIKVPEDVIVTGYDEAEASIVSEPRLTTVRREEESGGLLAYKYLKKAIQTGVKPVGQTILSEGKFFGSCGCNNQEDPIDVNLLKEAYLHSTMVNDNKSYFLKCILAESTGITQFSQYSDIAKKSISLINPEEVYICISGTPEEFDLELNNLAEGFGPGRDITQYADTTTMLIAYKNGRFLPEAQFPTKELLPDSYIDHSKGNILYFLPLHHQSHCFGYIIFANLDKATEDPFMPLFSLVVSNSLENILQHERLKRIMEKLDKLSVIDDMTGIYNRAGAKKMIPSIMEMSRKNSTFPLVLFIDMDALKSVNDRFGHLEGDSYIRAITEVLKRSCGRDDILIRIGGDEFVIITCVSGPEAIDSKTDRITRELINFNKENPCSYTRGISIGSCITNDPEHCDIMEMLKEADKDMYVKKMKKKEMRRIRG